MSLLPLDGEFPPKVSGCSTEIWSFILLLQLLGLISLYLQKMEKISKYNQKLLAIIGTITLFGISLFILIGGGVLATELFSGFNQRQIRDNSLAVESHQDSRTNAVRVQEVSFGDLRLIDTLNSI